MRFRFLAMALVLAVACAGEPTFSSLVWHDPGSGTTMVLASTDSRIDFLPAAFNMVRHVMDDA